MKKLATMTSMLAVTALLGFGISSCTTEDGPGTGTGNGPTAVAANSGSSSSINVRWQRQSSDVTADTVVAMANGAVFQTAVAAAPGNTATLTGLQEGVQYTISVRSNTGSSSSIIWMTARRSQMIRLYETADNTPGEFSGLVLGNVSGNAEAISVSSTATRRHEADLVLGSDATNGSGASHLSLVAGSVTTLSGLDAGKNTRFSTIHNATPGGMDNLYYTGDLSSLIPTTTADTVNAFDLPTTAFTDPVVMEIKTADNHYARVQIQPQANGLLYGGTAGRNFIDVIVSYQTTAGAPYASRPRPLAVESKHTFNKVSN